MKHCKIILLVGLLASSASALAGRSASQWPTSIKTFSPLSASPLRKRPAPVMSTCSLKTPAATPDARPIRCRALSPPAWTRSSSTRWTPPAPAADEDGAAGQNAAGVCEPDAGDKTLPPGVVFVSSGRAGVRHIADGGAGEAGELQGNVAIMIEQSH